MRTTPFDPSNPFPVPLPAGVAPSLGPAPSLDLPTLFAMWQKATQAGQNPASGLMPKPVSDAPARVPGATMWQMPTPDRPLAPGADSSLLSPLAAAPNGIGGVVATNAPPNLPPTPDPSAFAPVDPAKWGYVGNPTLPNLPAPIARNAAGEGSTANKRGLWAALAGLVLSGGDIRGALAGYAGGAQGGMAAGQEAFTDAQRQRQDAIQGQQVGYQNAQIGANNTNAAAARQEQADKENRAIAGQKYNAERGVWEDQRNQGNIARQEQERRDQIAAQQAQQRQGAAMGFIERLTNAPSEEAAGRMIKAAADAGLLDAWNLKGAFPQKADGTYDTSGFGKDDDATRGAKLMQVGQATMNNARTPESFRMGAEVYKRGYKLTNPDDETDLPDAGATGGQAVVKADTAATNASREKVAAANLDYKKEADAARLAAQDARAKMAQEGANYRAGLKGGGGKAADPVKYGLFLDGKIMQAQAAITRLSTPPTMAEIDPTNGYPTGRRIPRPLSVEEIQQRNQALAYYQNTINDANAAREQLRGQPSANPANAPITPANPGTIGAGGIAPYLNPAQGAGGTPAVALPPPPPGTKSSGGKFILPQPGDLLNPGAQPQGGLTGAVPIPAYTGPNPPPKPPPIPNYNPNNPSKAVPLGGVGDWRSYPVGTAFVGQDGRQWVRTANGANPASPSPLVPSRPQQTKIQPKPGAKTAPAKPAPKSKYNPADKGNLGL